MLLFCSVLSSLLPLTFLLALTSEFFSGVLRWVAFAVFPLHVTKSNNSLVVCIGKFLLFRHFFLFLCRNIRTKIPITFPRRQIVFDFHLDMNKYLVNRYSSSSTKFRNMPLNFLESMNFHPTIT